MNTRAEDISNLFTPTGMKNIKIGQILIFQKDGKRNELKITKIYRNLGKVWARPVRTYSPDEIKIVDVEK